MTSMRFLRRRTLRFRPAASTAIIIGGAGLVVLSMGGFLGSAPSAPGQHSALLTPTQTPGVDTGSSATPSPSPSPTPTPTAPTSLAATAAGTSTDGTAPSGTAPVATKTATPIRGTPRPAARTPAPTPPPPPPDSQGMPSGNLPGWQMTYAQDFNGTSLPSGWGAYSGEPGGDPHGWWNENNLTVSGGFLHFLGRFDASVGRYSTAGVSFGGDTQTYGMYLVRIKGDYEPGISISDIALLWPDANVWPPEIDFFEDGGGSRSGFAATLHPGPNGNDCCQIQHSHAMNATEWHTVGVEWTPTSISYLVDGSVWATVTPSQLDGGAHWPAQAMTLDLQSQNLDSNYPPGPTETMTVDWVVEYAFTG